MQLYFMNKDSIDISHASLALLVELMGFQAATMMFLAFGIIYNYFYILRLGPTVKLLITIGGMVNLAIFMLLVVFIFVPSAAYSMEKFLKRLCLKLKKRHWIKAVSVQMNEYRQSALYIRKNKVLLLKNMVTVLVQLLAVYSITYFVYLALGGEGYSWQQIFSLQAVLNAGVAMIPIPGTAGVGEAGFSLIFSSIFTGQSLMPGLLLSRGISFYFGMFISGVILMASMIGKYAQDYNFIRNNR